MKPNSIYRFVEMMYDLSSFQIVLLIVTTVLLWSAVCLKAPEKKVKIINLIGFTAGVFTILLLGLVNRVVFARELNLVPFRSFFPIEPHRVRQMLLNVLFFVPMGMTLPFLTAEKTGKPLLRSAFFGFALSLITELLQLALKRGTFETEDILSNTLGALIGAISFLIYARLRKKTDI